ncbi:hypothetical protein K456DRAFT_747872 [Colletotrichum gloeosporioides 23]|nr:hypothetical protein K456DRAFT_747872 [Colletotrichum gloeosporioides 23]
MFMSAPPRLGFHGSDYFAFEQSMTARAQQRFNQRRMRKLIARHGKHPFGAHRTPHHVGIMSNEDWPLDTMPDGIQDSFEAQQLRNRYLAGTAGSPYSDPDAFMLFQRMQQFDAPFSNKRPVMDHNQSWQPEGMPYANDMQSMFAPMQFQFGVSSVDDISMSASGGLSQNMPISSPVFSASESGASFGSFSSTGAPNLLDSGSFSSTDGSAIINSPPQQFDYVNSPFTSSSMMAEDLSSIKAVPPSPQPFSEPTPIHFFQAPHEQIAEPGRCHMDDRHAVGVSAAGSHSMILKSEPHARILPSKPRKELPEKPRSRRASSPARKSVPSALKVELRPKQSKPCPVPFSFAESVERSAKDEYLLKAKAEGLTYREIRVKGNFSEAESTLRGRYRTLTKSKEERVRKPEWTSHDIHLLKRAVRKFSKGNDPASTKIPWKQVAEYIYSHDGSYLFGNATCRKKWDELAMCSAGRRIRGSGTM